MTQAKGSVRRLAGLFNTSLSSATKTKPTTTSTASTTSTSIKPSSKSLNNERRLQKLVNKFKQSSERVEFRDKGCYIYHLTVSRLASAKQFSLIEEILEHQKKYQDISQERFVIRLMLLYGRAGMFEHAQKLFDEMPQLKCDRTVKSFNALLSSCMYSNKFDMVEKLLTELPEKVGMEPNLVSYNIVISSFCEMGSLDSALSVVDTLENKGIEPDITTFNTLLDALFMKGRVADGEKIWGLMAKKNVVPNIRSYNSKLRGLVNAHKLSEALELWEEMGSKGIKPDAYSYNALIKGYCDAENLEQAKKWFSELKKSGLSPDWFTYVILVHLYCKKYEFEKAIELCKEVINRRVLTGAAMFRTVIDALVKESRVEEAIQLMEFANPHFRYKLKLPST